MVAGSVLLFGASLGSMICQMFVTSSLPRMISHGLPAAALVGGVLWLERAGRVPRFPVLLLLGDASYSLYLVHGFVFAILRREWQRHFNVNLISTHVVFILVSTILAELVGIVVFKFAERPVTTSLTAALKRRGLLRSGGNGETMSSQTEPGRIVHTA